MFAHSNLIDDLGYLLDRCHGDIVGGVLAVWTALRGTDRLDP
jgi:hypothetical protein